MNKSVLTPAHAAFLDATFARNRSRFGGWFMEGPDDDAAAKAAEEKAAADKAAAEEKAAAEKRAAESKNALDADGKDLGYPKDTRVAEMTDAQQAAYHRYHSKKHESRYKSVVGDRTDEQVKADLEELAKIKREQMTPSEQAIAAAKEEGKQEAIASERIKTATALFRGALESSDMPDTEVEELVTGFNVAAFITDDGVDTTKITNFAKKFTKPGTGGTEQRKRDFGGGSRTEGGGGGQQSVKAVQEARRAAREAKNK
ncbi:hypothetical protein [Nocardioides marmoriginsengisoli]|uniref:hypothetical protein n=1 Tax=Nocardioides marmoriginsengisoli TaxID=661483 RepID=UPI0016077480|nr:hypothetical protein [Nocardioides marmoriginsengisoli]